MNPRPVTLLTGFLGSGKTTLLNALLCRPELAGTAVVVNEFGEIGIDHLLVERGVDNVLLLAGGCLCCTVATTLGDTLTELLGKEARGEVPAFVRVIVETTGLADPAPILRELWSDAFLRRHFPLNGIVVTVDTLHAHAELAHQREARRQVAVADRIVLTKTDLAGAAVRTEVEAAVAAINPGAPVVAAVRGGVDPARLIGISPDVADAGATTGESAGPAAEARRARVEAWLAADRRRERRLSGIAGTTAGTGVAGTTAGAGIGRATAGASAHSGRFVSVGVEVEGTVTWQALAAWMDRIRVVAGDGLLRCKGIVAIEGEARPVVIHGVRGAFHPPERLAGWPPGPRSTRIVVIGEDIDRAAIARTVDDLAADATAGARFPAAGEP